MRAGVRRKGQGLGEAILVPGITCFGGVCPCSFSGLFALIPLEGSLQADGFPETQTTDVVVIVV